jgi:hypothetical protein
VFWTACTAGMIGFTKASMCPGWCSPFVTCAIAAGRRAPGRTDHRGGPASLSTRECTRRASASPPGPPVGHCLVPR